jgi:hypothetical protein
MAQVAGRLTRLERQGSKAVLQMNDRDLSDDDDDDDDDDVSNAPVSPIGATLTQIMKLWTTEHNT